MSELFRRLADRAQGLAPLLAPRLPGRFEQEEWPAAPAAAEGERPPLAGAAAPLGAAAEGVDSAAPMPGSAAAPGAARAFPGEPPSGSFRPVWPRPPAHAAAPSATSGFVPEATPETALPPPRRRAPAAATPLEREAAKPSAVAPLAAAAPVHVARRAGESLAPPAAAPLSAPAAGSFSLPAQAPQTRCSQPAPEPMLPSVTARSDRPTAQPPQPGMPPPREAAAPSEPLSPAAAVTAPDAPPPVEITIGRVEIRFAPPSPAATPAPSRAVGPPPLDVLLARRHGR